MWDFTKYSYIDCQLRGDKVIMEYSVDGRHIRDIPVSDKPFDLAIIDSDNIAVSYENNGMEILNINNKMVHAKVTFEYGCFGISYQNGNIYILVCNKGIVEMDVSGKRLRTIGGKYAKVYCCSMMGEDIWTFTDQSLVDPRGLSADGDGNVFVVGSDSNNLMMIQHDGKVSKTLLTESDGLNHPAPYITIETRKYWWW
ncbi:unnamed protein product [Mytilus edulis]|uniref:Uncharacterized protein n=1 Tax=Mytilus edulis TaxID=6550 RepID=A0A8S3TBZ9_MYTED|nr:unnamed protein product [Mytilus edulis]